MKTVWLMAAGTGCDLRPAESETKLFPMLVFWEGSFRSHGCNNEGTGLGRERLRNSHRRAFVCCRETNSWDVS